MAERASFACALLLVCLTASRVTAGARTIPVVRPFASVPPKLERRAGTDFVLHELLVGFRRPAAPSVRTRVLAAVGAGATLGKSFFGSTLLSLPPGVRVTDAVDRLRSMKGVAWAVPNMRTRYQEFVPTDPSFADQWGLRNVAQSHTIADPPPSSVLGLNDADIDVSDAWSTTLGSSETVIAVIDSGVDVTHPDLAASLWTNLGEIPGNGIDDDGNGYVDDTNGWDFVENDAVPQDTVGHGTLIAGIIAATQGNGIGGSGVCPECKVMVLRESNLAQELRAISYAIDNGADIINASYGYDVYLLPEWKAFKAASAAGILTIAAAGNSGGDNDMSLGDFDRDGQNDAPLFPASFDLPGIISVAASNDHDQYGYQTGCALETGKIAPCFFSNFGHDAVDLAAPGVDVMSTVPGGGYATEDGTSMAAPVVSGAAGLVESIHPTYSPLEVRDSLMNAVDHPSSLAGGWTRTSGRLNAATALAASTTPRGPASIGNIATARWTRGRSKGRLSYPKNVNDVFKVKLRRGVRYGVALDVPAHKDYDLYVWKPGTSQIWQVEPGCNWVGGCKWLLASSAHGKGKDEVVDFRARKRGTYYLQVTSWFSSGRYKLLIGRI
jgi:subtilisin family serine protease